MDTNNTPTVQPCRVPYYSCRDHFIVIIYRRLSRDLACCLRTSDQEPTVFECRLFPAS